MNESSLVEVELFWLNFFAVIMIISVTINIAVAYWVAITLVRNRRARRLRMKNKETP